MVVIVFRDRRPSEQFALRRGSASGKMLGMEFTFVVWKNSAIVPQKIRQISSRHRDLASVAAHQAGTLKELGDIEMKRNDPDKALPLQKKPVQLKHDIGIAYSDLGTIFSSENNIRMR